MTIDRERIKNLNNREVEERGEYIGCWIQNSPRIRYNHTLEYAKYLCEKHEKPLLVFFVLNKNFPEARRRAFQFLLEGVSQFKRGLGKSGIELSIFEGDPQEIVKIIGDNAVAVITDKGYLKFQRELNQEIAKDLKCSFYEIESNVVVPVEVASNHEEYGAYTIRGKITKQIGRFLSDPLDEYLKENFKIKSYNNISGKIKSRITNLGVEKDLKNFYFDIENSKNIEKFILAIEDDNFYQLEISGGEIEAERVLDKFIENRLDSYHLYSNNPFFNVHSELGPYLHFGQISPAYIYRKISESGRDQESIEAFLEELVVRRELAFNFCYFNENYFDFKKILQDWCYETLEKHWKDKREYIYTLEELEDYETHDNYWNQAQKELVTKGTMPNYMRMYWAKKILEWSEDPEKAFNNTIYLNNRYFLDGRDPNSYAGVAWCYGKHDRAWTERPIFGKIRYMNESGIEKRVREFKKLQKSSSELLKKFEGDYEFKNY